VIPDPPLDDDGRLRVHHHDIVATIARGSFGVCVLCTSGCYEWWDLTRCDMPPVTDRLGTLTDQVTIHGACVPELLSMWGNLLHEGSGGEALAPDAESAAGARSTDEREPEREHEPRARRRRAPMGAYAETGA
jgi:hypothetical protein